MQKKISDKNQKSEESMKEAECEEQGKILLHFAVLSEDEKNIIKAIKYKNPKEKNFEKLVLLIKKCRNINIQDADNNTFLHHAIINKNKNIIGIILAEGAKIDIRNNNGETAFHLVVRMLCEKIGKKEGTIESIEVKNSEDLLTSIMQNKDFDINIKNNQGFTALHMAVISKSENIVELLVKNNANVDVQNNRGNAALHLAINQKYENIVELLVRNGADLDIKNALGKSPLNIAKGIKNNERIIGILENAIKKKQQNDKQEKTKAIPSISVSTGNKSTEYKQNNSSIIKPILNSNKAYKSSLKKDDLTQFLVPTSIAFSESIRNNILPRLWNKINIFANSPTGLYRSTTALVDRLPFNKLVKSTTKGFIDLSAPVILSLSVAESLYSLIENHNKSIITNVGIAIGKFTKNIARSITGTIGFASGTSLIAISPVIAAPLIPIAGAFVASYITGKLLENLGALTDR